MEHIHEEHAVEDEAEENMSNLELTVLAAAERDNCILLITASKASVEAAVEREEAVYHN